MIGKDETAREWARDFTRCARTVRSPRDAWDTFVAFFVPHWTLRLHRRIRYQMSRKAHDNRCDNK